MLDLKLLSDHIADPPLRAYTRRMLDNAAPEFWTAPASTSGKYHPEFDDGCGGLARHVALVTLMAVDGLRRYWKDGAERLVVDAVICASLLHDITKNGHPKWGPHTVRDHPAIAEALMRGRPIDGGDWPESTSLAHGWAAYAVGQHYGVWTDGGACAPPELTLSELCAPSQTSREHVVCALVLQEADYYASRRYLGAPVRARMEAAMDPFEVKGVNPVELP
jgi:hypothetical protein